LNYFSLNQNKFSDNSALTISKKTAGNLLISKDLQPYASSTVKENKSKFFYKTENTVSLHITKFSDIIDIIIPFFEKYPVLGYKSLDFLDFKSVAEIIKTKEHLTEKGFNKIELIILNMNQRRK